MEQSQVSCKYNPHGCPQEPSDKQKREKELQDYLENIYPYPLWAIKHYNETRKEGEEQYKVSGLLGPDACMYYSGLGFLHVLYFMAEPKSLEKPDPSAAKCFFARVHQKPDETHVPCCTIVESPPKCGSAIPFIPICCEDCGLQDRAAFQFESKKFRQEAELRRLAGEEVRISHVKTPLYQPCNCQGRGPVDKSGSSSLGGGKFQAEASSEGGSGFLDSPSGEDDLPWHAPRMYIPPA